MIPYGKQSIDQTDIDAVIDVLNSDWLTQGPKVPQFEKAVVDYTGSKNAIAVNSATSALHIACLALNVAAGDLVWTSPISFVASSNCALYCGATVDFIDINQATGNMCTIELERKLIIAKKNEQLPKVIIPVHLAGQSCDMKRIYALSLEYGFSIIEDASHAIGAKYQNKPVGNCQYSDICVFSFHPVKIITSAEGGMATTNDPELARKMQLLRSHGVTSVDTEMTEPSHGPWYYQQISLGFNYRMSDIHAALGLSQLQKVDTFVAKRHKLANLYVELLDDTLVTPLVQTNNTYSAYHLFIVQLKVPCKTKHRELVTQLRSQNIIGHVHYIPIHLQPYYQALGFEPGDYLNAECYYDGAVTLPLYPELTIEQVQYVVKTVHDILS
ncbi:UDP-4-amino-4,6-dideoxy-N-acetyl-beta-L-altrosamine transaminase [Pseudoalteromonas citrea]|uniref:UDP-4-amino-4, 6-dideoxy-N-acetyl-beta-L-altrosamine transaminase n=1 Tax=Pseudoalteromonas citrea TaxID=43655 RepID=A0A5S3XTW7_9GAMM|nr:UDP-4-amino-4,6-dideoxy-N-acetyl-beta-L-altrosamine transaminase [Pseudoalteromonas citrea]TMP43473.1 UDP-4-amino-4,6-dideoxy-N-acetyl-beta-L-altrosamine transaminase [Pseudoalteromonas citrea]TMP62128.1 UDP-4-amino-4,6-dideoxy-N-acetyl-beta-L-altrosamine transaminase [Pseudoalteromonas citrea]